jgi:hypothetical protein
VRKERKLEDLESRTSHFDGSSINSAKVIKENKDFFMSSATIFWDDITIVWDEN